MDEIQRNQLGPELSESPERRPEEPSEPETVRPAEAENAPEAQAPEEASSLSSAPAPDEGQSPSAPACEVVEYYQPRETREVVEYYIQPRPLPRRLRPVQPAARKRKKKGLVIFLICTALLAALATGAHFWTAAEKTDSADHGSDSGKTYTDEMTAAVSIPNYEPDGDVQFTVTEEHGQELTAQEVYAKVNPSVVTVMVQLDNSMSVGTGVIFTADGYLLTNYHVVAGGTDCSVALSSGKTYAAKYVTGDSKNDVAVLKVQAEGLPAAEIGNSDDLTVGDRVYAIGNPLGVELRGTLTDGIVSAINRDVKVDGRTMTLVQTNAALNEGNSGGPLINRYGQVVGINTIKMSSAFSSIEGLGFALPTASLQYIVNDLLTYGEVRPEPVIGVSVSQTGTALSDGTQGIEVLEVSKNSAADKAGVRTGDIIVAAGGESVTTSQDLLRIRHRCKAGDVLTLRIWRDGSYQDFNLTLTEGTD